MAAHVLRDVHYEHRDDIHGEHGQSGIPVICMASSAHGVARMLRVSQRALSMTV
jgi:hypothetical protein